jgi:hypothetical protein
VQHGGASREDDVTDKDRALYAGGALAALIVGGVAAKLILMPADMAASHASMHAVTALGAPDAFGSGGHLTAMVTPPSSPIMPAFPAARQVADIVDPPTPKARPSAHPPAADDSQASVPPARDASASVSETADTDSEPGQATSQWGRSYAAPPERTANYVWRPSYPPPRATPYPPPPRYAGYGPPPGVARPWESGPPPGAEDDGPD